MNYYPFHLGDYASHTAHLDPLEDLAYRRMLDVYYLREQALPGDPHEVARLIRMRQNLDEVEVVLREFFVLTDIGWAHERCDEEIDRMRDKQTKARASAAASVSARKAKAQPQTNDGSTVTQRTLSDRSTDVELPTPTPIPIPKEEERARKRIAPPSRPDGVTEQTWQDWLQLRKAKRAAVTTTVINGALTEAAKAGLSLEDFLQIWCRRGSQGLEAAWILSTSTSGGMPWHATDSGVAAKGRELGLEAHRGETSVQFKARVIEAVNAVPQKPRATAPLSAVTPTTKTAKPAGVPPLASFIHPKATA